MPSSPTSIDSISSGPPRPWVQICTEALVGAVRARWPDLPLTLHLHDTRGMAVACAHVALGMGVSSFDASVGGLGGCPFAAQRIPGDGRHGLVHQDLLVVHQGPHRADPVQV